MPTALASGHTLLFIGDSITDCDRRSPQHAPLGWGYVKLFSDLITIREPEKTVTIINRGISGNTVENLRSRWHEDVLLHRPDWLSVKIGINDVNQHLNQANADWLSPRMFREIYHQLLTLTRETLPQCQLLLISPFFISRDAVAHSYRAKVLAKLPEYVAAVEQLREEFGARYVPLHTIFQAQLAHRHPDTYCPEPVHPNATGHLLMAESVYAALSA